MAAITWETVEDGIHAWVADTSGFDPSLIRWEYQGGPREIDYIALEIVTVGKVGQDYIKHDNSPTFGFTADYTTGVLTGAQGMRTGIGPVRAANAGGALPTGLSSAVDYWSVAVAADGSDDIHTTISGPVLRRQPVPPRYSAKTFKLATSRANALAGITVDIADNGTGTHTIVPAPGAELRSRALGMRTAKLMIHGFGQSAVRALVDVVSGLELHIAALDAAGVGIGDIDPVQQIPMPTASGGATLEREAVTGVMMHLASELESRQTYVERVQLTLTENTIGPVGTFWVPTAP